MDLKASKQMSNINSSHENCEEYTAVQLREIFENNNLEQISKIKSKYKDEVPFSNILECCCSLDMEYVFKNKFKIFKNFLNSFQLPLESYLNLKDNQKHI